MSHKNDNFLNRSLIFEIIASITCVIIIISVIIVTFYFFKENVFKNKVNYNKVTTALNEGNQVKNYDSSFEKLENASNLNEKATNYMSHAYKHSNSVSKMVNKKCQCNINKSLSGDYNDVSNTNLSCNKLSNPLLNWPMISISDQESSADCFDKEPNLMPQSILYPCYPGIIPFAPYSYFPISSLSWNMINQPFLNKTNPKSSNSIISSSLLAAEKTRTKTCQDKSSQCCENDNKLIFSPFHSTKKSDSEFLKLKCKQETRHGAKLKTTFQAHQIMMHELYLKAIKRIQRLDKENQKHYQLD